MTMSEDAKRQVLELSRNADQFFDEHGKATRGDHLWTRALDFTPSPESLSPPYCDYGGQGLGLIAIHRKRVYAGGKWSPKITHTRYLIGRNEVGTYFSHSVSCNCSSVQSAVQWIWQGKAEKIIARQGDIALAWGVCNKKCVGLPKGVPQLPHGHEVVENHIVHNTHPAIVLPRSGMTVIVGRRAYVRVSEATRD